MGNNDFNLQFLSVLMDCKKKFDSKKVEYGDSWKTCEMTFLRMKLEKEYNEFEGTDTLDTEYKELIDLINVALMLAKRISKYREE